MRVLAPVLLLLMTFPSQANWDESAPETIQCIENLCQLERLRCTAQVVGKYNKPGLLLFPEHGEKKSICWIRQRASSLEFPFPFTEPHLLVLLLRQKHWHESLPPTNRAQSLVISVPDRNILFRPPPLVQESLGRTLDTEIRDTILDQWITRRVDQLIPKYKRRFARAHAERKEFMANPSVFVKKRRKELKLSFQNMFIAYAEAYGVSNATVRVEEMLSRRLKKTVFEFPFPHSSRSNWANS